MTVTGDMSQSDQHQRDEAGPEIVSHPGNSPLTDPPADYCPMGSGRWLVLPDGLDAGKKLFFYDHVYGDGDPQQTVLFVHGNPESSYTYRKVIREIVKMARYPVRVVAMDHIGFGLSDQASFEMVDMHHAANLQILIRTLDLRDVTLVVHDWGGPIGIGAFLEEDPERVSRLVVLNSTVFPIPESGSTFRTYPLPVLFSWAETPKRVPDRLWGVHAAFAVNALPAPPLSLIGSYLVFHLRHALGWEREEDHVWKKQFSSPMNARSSKRMVRQTPVWGHGYIYTDARKGRQDNRPFYRMIQEKLPRCWGPEGSNIVAQGIWGEWDPLAKSGVLDQWREALPQMAGHIRVIPHASHFIEEQEPGLIASTILH